MKRGVYYKRLSNDKVQCTLCPFKCVIAKGAVGHCNTRFNHDGDLYSLTYGNPTGFQVDHIEKKPFFHFNPGSRVLSFGTQGCNFRCKYCCNYFFSQRKPELNGARVTPEQIVNKAILEGCEGIAYTYNEPTIFLEYAFDTMKLAHEKGLFNVFVTNGCVNKAPLQDVDAYLDAVVIDFKGFNEVFYNQYVEAKLDWVKQGVKYYSKLRAHKEVTNLVVPGLNDDPAEIRKLGQFIIKNLGPNTPVHLLRFFPLYKMKDVPETPISILKRLHSLLKEEGFRYVYLGNTGTKEENTYCPYCGELLLMRRGNRLVKNYLNGSSCPNCDEKIPIKGRVKEDFDHLPYFG